MRVIERNGVRYPDEIIINDLRYFPTGLFWIRYEVELELEAASYFSGIQWSTHYF